MFMNEHTTESNWSGYNCCHNVDVKIEGNKVISFCKICGKILDVYSLSQGYGISMGISSDRSNTSASVGQFDNTTITARQEKQILTEPYNPILDE